jgi:cytochrome c553
LQQALLDFKYDKTNATLMPRIAKAYSDAEISAVAAYLSQQ